MISAGEASGDLHGATLCRALRQLAPDMRLLGMGGPRMAAAGLEVLIDPTARAVVGGTEVLRRLPMLLGAYRTLARRLQGERARALVVIDFPDFNMRLARQARRMGVPVVYFIPPQAWAWRHRRASSIARLASRVLTVLPFEGEFYQRAGARVEFVGHPLLDVLPLDLGREEARRRLGLLGDDPVVGLFPGSRRDEVERLLPAMLTAAAELGGRTGRRFLLGRAASVDRDLVSRIVARSPAAEAVEVLDHRTHEIMRAANAALVASGTATLEAALLGAPMVVCYRVSRLTEAAARLLIQVRWISLPNLLAGRPLVPEVLQREVSGPRLAAEMRRLLEDRSAAEAQREGFRALRRCLGEPGVGGRAAAAVLDACAA
jgi:lipid-A-disaccharide synthase